VPEGTSRGTRREESHKELKKVVGHIVKSIDNYIAGSSGDPKIKQMLKTAKPGLMKRSLKYEEVMRNIEDDELAISILYESIAFIGSTFIIGTIGGGGIMVRHIKRQLRDELREKTANGRRVALEKRSPIMQQKRDITIEIARSYLIQSRNNKPATVNALMVQIRNDVEKQCKLEQIKAPSTASMWAYLDKANLL
jgi:uncharacterized membrane-anchored protein YjiN (DUF445 family)